MLLVLKHLLKIGFALNIYSEGQKNDIIGNKKKDD